MRMLAMGCVASVLLVFGPLTSARAEVALTWHAPTACSDEASFQRAFQRAMGTPVEAFGATSTRVEVTFMEAERGWSVHVEATSGGLCRTRELSTPARSCHRLDEGVLVVVGLLVDEVSREAEAHPIQLPEAPSAPEAETSTPTPEAPTPSSPDGATLEGAFIAGARGRIDALPGFVMGPRFAGEVRLIPEVRLGLGIELYPEATSLAPDGSGVGVAALAPFASLCGLASLASWVELGGCAGVDVILLEARGLGLDETRTGRGVEVDVLLEGRTNIALFQWLWLHLTVGVGLAPVRSRIFFREAGMERLLHMTSLFFPTASLALEVRLGS